MMRARMLFTRWWSALGPAGWCGVLGALAAVWLHAGLLPQREAELAQARTQAQAPRPSPRASHELTAGERTAAFEALFPPADTLPDWLERIEAASAAAGVVVERTEYRLATGAPASLARYQIALPVKGTYSQVRAFIAGLLEAVPTLAVTDIEVKRESIASATIDARVNVAVYLRGVRR